MTQHVRDVMTARPVTVEPVASVASVARVMRDENIGAVLVAEQERLRGLVSDRDLVVRVLAEGGDPERTTVGDACSGDLVTVGPDDELRQAVAAMREHAVRRVPVVDGERNVVGVVSLADLAIERDPDSALGDISAAKPNR
ncbi:CBS domain-containing protein [Streptomyces roseirectus]|uniref:CBS domain-containing protein n=1 Tax=Streptomyces roseirectus TaxID=2768066 RepID=A0A7H0IRI1_9ACTN|nr:CBS domain-containing protein [Streptomyces roseirectus]QNP75397.1 CBS domain-containing protein [Streptomyces roseirectus]